MEPHLGSLVLSTKVCKLHRDLYGLKQAPHDWFAKFTSTIRDFGFSSSAYDYALFICKIECGIILPFLYVDDTIVTGDDTLDITSLE